MSDALTADIEPDLPEEKTLSDEEADKLQLYWMHLALCLGYNELAKMGKQLGDKVYFRLLRQQAQERFIEVGGHGNVFAEESEAIVTIEVSHGFPRILFRERDIEMMRDAVHAHDVARRAPTSDPSAKGGAP